METCPSCGAKLAANLVAAIKDPRREETCPKFAQVFEVPEVVGFDGAEIKELSLVEPRHNLLAGLMLLGNGLPEGPKASAWMGK